MPCDSNFLFIFYIFTHLFYTTQLLSLHKRHISLLRDRNKSIYLSIINRYTEESLLQPASTSMKSHSTSLLYLSQNPAAAINGKSLKEFLQSRITKIQCRHYYLQFSRVPPSFTDDSDDSQLLSLFPALEISHGW